jgi:2-keto-4-pentenoate hydratase/2-oxohepta-3-ene-1,7-dioic acid hydratase in catechol pathway
MHFVTFELDGKARPGLITGQEVVDLSEQGFNSLLEVIEGIAERRIDPAKLVPSVRSHKLAAVRLKAPIPKPRKFICVGLNYLDHAKESGVEIPEVPTIFSKFATTVIGPGDPIVLPKVSQAPDYEGEFAVIIGRGGRHIKADDWRDHVFGYTVVNDVSARDFQRATSQWLMGKTFDTFGPMGPWIVTADELPDPHNVNIRTEINGEVLQDSNTCQLIFKIPQLLAFLSSVFTLEPGDVLSTGTPSGVGFARTPPRWLKPGDDVVVKIAGVGELRNPVVAEN